MSNLGTLTHHAVLLDRTVSVWLRSGPSGAGPCVSEARGQNCWPASREPRCVSVLTGTTCMLDLMYWRSGPPQVSWFCALVKPGWINPPGAPEGPGWPQLPQRHVSCDGLSSNMNRFVSAYSSDPDCWFYTHTYTHTYTHALSSPPTPPP